MKCLYQIAEHTLFRFEMPVISSNMYVLTIESSCLIVDPFVSEEAEKLLRNNRIRECLVLLTHEHLDHISGVNWIRNLCSCKVMCSDICGKRIMDARKSGAAYFEALFLNHAKDDQETMRDIFDLNYTCWADQTYVDEISFQWCGLRINMRETPGHSPGSQIISINDLWFFTGDTLIPGQDAITRLPGGSKREYLEKALPYLRGIPDNGVVFPGHGGEGLYSEIEVR